MESRKEDFSCISTPHGCRELGGLKIDRRERKNEHPGLSNYLSVGAPRHLSFLVMIHASGVTVPEVRGVA